MLLLQLPFNADSLLGLVFQIANTVPALPPGANSSAVAEGDDPHTAPIHREWRDMISRCLVKDAAARPTAAELLGSVVLLREENCSRRKGGCEGTFFH